MHPCGQRIKSRDYLLEYLRTHYQPVIKEVDLTLSKNLEPLKLYRYQFSELSELLIASGVPTQGLLGERLQSYLQENNTLSGDIFVHQLGCHRYLEQVVSYCQQQEKPKQQKKETKTEQK